MNISATPSWTYAYPALSRMPQPRRAPEPAVRFGLNLPGEHPSFRKLFALASAVSIAAIELAARFIKPVARLAYLVVLPFVALGIRDMTQTKHALLRNFPILGHIRFLSEVIRPEIQQYFVENDTEGKPFSREQRNSLYEGGKGLPVVSAFGTKRDFNVLGTEWINHSMAPLTPKIKDPRVTVGGPWCKKPYDASLLNVSAMSYGALSKNAILALNKGAKKGGFAHNTGEGGISPYHLQNGADLIWQVGTGYFGCRDKNGNFSREEFTQNALLDNVKMIELKMSQGAKPSHGGILPGKKNTPEIAKIRGVEPGTTVLSPPSHSAFSNPVEMMKFIGELRDLSGGKPVGFKLCVGNKHEFLAICKAMLQTNIYPDFITVDGSEGGTGAAPRPFADAVGMPLNDALVFVHNALMGINKRDEIKIIASGKMVDAQDIVSKMAMGANMLNMARGFMIGGLGCIQAGQCNTNTCPTGIATQEEELMKGLVVEEKAERTYNLHHDRIHSVMELMGAAGLEHPSQLRPYHVQRRVADAQIKNLQEVYEYIPRGSLLGNAIPKSFLDEWQKADPSSFLAAPKAIEIKELGPAA